MTAIWSGSRLHYFEALKEPRDEDFEIGNVHRPDGPNGNRVACLSNGYGYSELEEDEDLAWYFDARKGDLEAGTSAY